MVCLADLNSRSLDDCTAEYFNNIVSEASNSCAANLRLVQAYGKLQSIELSKGCQFYCKPWGAPLLVTSPPACTLGTTC